MELQSPLKYDPNSLTRELAAGIILPSDQFSSLLCIFPGNNCIPEWQVAGDFFVSCTVYDHCKQVGAMHSKHCHESEYLEVNFEEILELNEKPVNGLLMVEVCHSAKIPVDVYVSHVHRKTGTYVSYPASTFIGDKIYTETHARELENALFWPGLVGNDHSKTYLGVLNPFKLSFFYQLTLYPHARNSVKSKVLKIAPYDYILHSLEDEFPILKELSQEELSQSAVCISAQYKIKSLMLIENRETGAFTTIDHMHTYCIY